MALTSAYMDIVAAIKAQIALLAVPPRNAWIDDTAAPPKFAPILGLESIGPGVADRARNHSLVVAKWLLNALLEKCIFI